MIINGLLQLVVGLLGLLLAPFPSVPALPAGVSTLFETLVGYIVSGLAILSNFCYYNIVSGLLVVSIACITLYDGYLFVMWILRKIPMIGIN